MDTTNNYTVEKLFIDSGFNTKLIQVEEARKEANQNQMIFGSLILLSQGISLVFGLGVFISVISVLMGLGVSYIINCVFSVGVIIGLRRFIKWADLRVKSFVNKYTSLLFYLQKDAIEAFIKIIFPSATNIAFEPQISSSNALKPVVSSLFSNNLEQYNQKNTLSFNINTQLFQLADVEPIFAINSSQERTELDKFRHGRDTVCFCKGIVYYIDYPHNHFNTQCSTIMIPKNVPHSPTKKVKNRNRTAIVSQDYPWLTLVNRQRGCPDRFIQRGFEEYSPENMEMEDEFYVFTNNETASRKFLSYRMMETIVTATLDKYKDVSQPKMMQFLLGSQREIPKFWIEFSNNNYQKKLTVLSTNRDLGFFSQVGQKSLTLENFQENFFKLNELLKSIILDLDVMAINQN